MDKKSSMEPQVEDTNPQMEQSQGEPNAEAQKKPIGALFGNITYQSTQDVTNFLDKMTRNDSVFVLLSAARYGQAKGIYSLEEAEAVSKAIRLFVTPPEGAEQQQPAEDQILPDEKKPADEQKEGDPWGKTEKPE